MMKDITILTFDEVERIRQDLDHMIHNALEGANRGMNSIQICSLLADELTSLRNMFD